MHIFSISSYPSPLSTVETSIGRAPFAENTLADNTKLYSTYEPSSQAKYSPDKYLIAEKIQNALRQQPAYAQVCNKIEKIVHQSQFLVVASKPFKYIQLYKIA